MSKRLTKLISASVDCFMYFFIYYVVPLFILLYSGRVSVFGKNPQSEVYPNLLDYDWTQFGWNASSSSAPLGSTGITVTNVAFLRRRQVHLDGTADSSPIYLHDVIVRGSNHDVFFVTTTYGKTIAIDANVGAKLWEYTPPKYINWAGTSQFTNSTPAADPDRRHIYAAAPDGTIQKLAVSDGHVLWRTPITLLPGREKISSPLKQFQGHLIAVTGGYVGDRPPYQGHVAILDTQSGKLLHVWNSLCSDRAGLLEPSSCPASGSAIWGRAGAAIEEDTGNIFVATGNGPYNGTTNWGDSVIELNPDATRMLGNYAPVNTRQLSRRDLDIGSTSPFLLSGHLLAQGGKDGLIRLLSTHSIAGIAPHQDHERQIVRTPSGALFTAPAVWCRGTHVWIFAADYGGTAAWTLRNDEIAPAWHNTNAGTSPVVAGGLLYVYDPQGGLRIYEPASGIQVANLKSGKGHWNSPVVVYGKIALPEGDANKYASDGVLDIWTLPTKY